MKRLVIAAGVIAALLSMGLGGAQAAGKKITIATEGAYEPFNYVAPDGTLQGFDVDIAKALCAKMKLQCKIVKQQWDGMIPALQAKKFDAIIASMSITDERKKKVDFSEKYYNTPGVLFGPKTTDVKIDPATGNPDFTQLAGQKVCVQGSTTHENFARAKFTGADIATYDTADNANADLLSGRCKVRMDDKIVALELMKKNPDIVIYGKGWFDRQLLGVGAGIAVRKEDTKLRDAFTKAIAEIRKDGTYKKINDKYFSFDVYGE
ncbi:MAG TPA: transporter substrate-binding domain-containing protein [Dongiaceae bacterium]|jgi:polar amino acid transport system substrate-binding protein|nr:transporter substrate-binding domain-containing protein [Dongiaceae bacterium]